MTYAHTYLPFPATNIVLLVGLAKPIVRETRSVLERQSIVETRSVFVRCPREIFTTTRRFVTATTDSTACSAEADDDDDAKNECETIRAVCSTLRT